MDRFALPEDEEYVEETDTGDQPLRDSQPTQIGMRSKSHIHKSSNEKAQNTHSRRLRPDDQTAQHSPENAEIISHSRCLCSEDQTAWHSATAIKKSSQVLPPAPALMLGSRVTRIQGKTPAEALTASTADPFTYAEAMEIPQRDHCNGAMEEDSTSSMLRNTFSALNCQEARQLHVKPMCISNDLNFRLKHPGVLDGSDGSDGTSYALTENYTLPVASHTYLLYFVVAYTHHQNDTCVTLCTGAAVMLTPFTQRLAIDDKPGSTWERRRHVWEHFESQSCIQFVFSCMYLCIYIATHLHTLYLDWLRSAEYILPITLSTSVTPVSWYNRHRSLKIYLIERV